MEQIFTIQIAVTVGLLVGQLASAVRDRSFPDTTMQDEERAAQRLRSL
jgi:hypothetical protein